MKKINVLLFIFLFGCNFLFADVWIEQVSGVTVQLTSVSGVPLNSPKAWICGYSGTVLRTTNNGTNWLNVSGNGIPGTVQLVSIAAIDENNAVTAGYIGTTTYLFRTTNAGLNWTQVLTQSNGFFDAVCMTSATNGFLAGDPVNNRWSLWKTTNGGAGWDSTSLFLPAANSTEAGWNNAMFCFQNKIWIGTNNSRIYYSSNNGINWIVQSTGSEVNSYALWFFSPDSRTDGVTGGTNLMVTTNQGSNWTMQTSLGTGNFGGFMGNANGIDNSQLEAVWYVRSDNKIYYSSNNAFNWIVEHTASGSGTYRHIGGSYPLWAVRSDGGISYHPLIASVQQVGSEVPKTFSLSQNYPNPFNPETKIKFQIASSSFTTLIIYDELGREIKSLVNEQLNPGTFEISWNANDNPSGLYFYKLESGGFTQTKKMLLIK